MMYIVFLALIIIFYIILRCVFDIDLRKLKEFGEDKSLNCITDKFPENKEVCRECLAMLGNSETHIEEDKKSEYALYMVLADKIFIGELNGSYTRLQTIAHECLHSIQSKKMLWFNFIFSNLVIVYFFVVCVLKLMNKISSDLPILLLLLFGLVFYVVRAFLENDAMIKARFLVKDYMEKQGIVTKEEVDKVLNRYDEINDIGIKSTNFLLLQGVLWKVVIMLVIYIIR